MRTSLATLLGAAMAPGTHAGSISGTVRVPAMPGPDTPFRPYAGRAQNLPVPVRPARGPVTDVVLHVGMAAFILVVPSHAWTRPGAGGAYEMSGLPAGRCQLHWWHPDFAPGEATVDVPVSGDTTQDVSF